MSEEGQWDWAGKRGISVGGEVKGSRRWWGSKGALRVERGGEGRKRGGERNGRGGRRWTGGNWVGKEGGEGRKWVRKQGEEGGNERDWGRVGREESRKETVGL